jgi:hypothetical protein
MDCFAASSTMASSARPDRLHSLDTRPGRKGSGGIAFDYHPPPFANHSEQEMLALARDDDDYGQMLAQSRALHLLYLRDPLLDSVMARLAPPWDTRHVSGLCHAADNALLAFDDSWTALGWSEWWTHRCQADRAIDVIVLHVDDHRDLIAPFLKEADRGHQTWRDRFTGDPVSLDRPGSVARAIASRAIGIGSFFAPWIHTLDRVEIRHLRPGREATLRSTLTRGPGVSLLEHPLNGSGGSAYIATSDLDEWTADVPAHARILLHIDLDYFNDRYAGARPTMREEPSTIEMIASVQQVCAALTRHRVGSRVEHTAIGMSPGFCPSECWELLLWHLRDGLRRAGCPGI